MSQGCSDQTKVIRDEVSVMVEKIKSVRESLIGAEGQAENIRTGVETFQELKVAEEVTQRELYMEIKELRRVHTETQEILANFSNTIYMLELEMTRMRGLNDLASRGWD